MSARPLLDTFLEFFCTPSKGMRIDREVLVVFAKAAGLTGTKLDPNGADLAAKLLGIGLCLFGAAMDFIASAIVLVAIPYYVRLTQEATPGGIFKFSNYKVGACIGMYYGGQILGNPLMTGISDRLGRRFAILLCLAGQAAGYALQGFSSELAPEIGVTELEMFMIARAITGIFGSTRPLAEQYIGDVGTRSEKPRFLALLGVVVTIGQIFGFGLGAGMFDFSPRTPMLCACAIMCFGLIMLYFFLDEPAMFDNWERKMRALQASTGAVAMPDYKEKDEDADFDVDEYEGPELSDRGKDRQVKLYALLCQLMYGCCFIHTFTAYGFKTLLALFILDKYAMGARQYGFVLMGFSIAVSTCQVVFFSLFLPRGGKHVCAVLGFIFASVGLFVLPIASDGFVGNMICLLPVAMGYAFVAPSMQVLLARYSSARKRKETFMRGSIASLCGMFLGPICFAALHQANKKHPLETAFFVCGSMTVIAMMLMVAIIQENAMLPEHKEHEDEPNYELLQVVKLGKMIGVFIGIPYQCVRTGFGIYLLTTQWGIEGGCTGVLFQVYVAIAAVCIVFVRWTYLTLLVSFIFTVIGLVSLNVGVKGSQHTCPNTIWETATNVDLVVIYGICGFYYMFFVSAFRRAEGFTSKVVRMVSMPINLARLVLGVLFCLYYYGTKMQPKLRCEGEGATTAQQWYTTYVLLSTFTFLFTVHSGALHTYHTMKALVGFVALLQYDQCDNHIVWVFVAVDTCITISISCLFYCTEATMRYAKLHMMTAHEYAKFLAGHVIGIPLALARMVFGYALCILDWDVEEEGCGDELWMYKLYVILAMLTFIPVVNTKIFGLYSIMLTVLGIFTLLKYKGCSNWHLFVETDMFVGVVGATVVYIVWVFVLDHPSLRGGDTDESVLERRREKRDGGHGYRDSVEEGMFYKEESPAQVERDLEAPVPPGIMASLSQPNVRGGGGRSNNAGREGRGNSLPPGGRKSGGIPGPIMRRIESQPGIIEAQNLEPILVEGNSRRRPGGLERAPPGQRMELFSD